MRDDYVYGNVGILRTKLSWLKKWNHNEIIGIIFVVFQLP
jgi:hypothetical protein